MADTSEHALLLAQLRDRLRQGEQRPAFLGFLSESQCAAAQAYLGARQHDAQVLFWGGHPEAERRMCGVFPHYLAPETDAFPIAAVTLRHRPADVLRHKDFLGAILALGLERDAVGDLLIEEGRCVAFLREELAAYVLQSIEMIGRVGVQVSAGMAAPLPPMHHFVELGGVVASERLDCLVGLLCKRSREQAAELIRAGQVFVNHSEAKSASLRVCEGDRLTVRRYGKFIIDRLGPQTGKGRLRVACRRYA